MNHTPARNYNNSTTNFLLSPSNSNSIIKEEISTIFVVGFPENMQEREFQNMFIFCPGFEAATLKLPNNTHQNTSIDEEEDGNKKQIVSFYSIVYHRLNTHVLHVIDWFC